MLRKQLETSLAWLWVLAVAATVLDLAGVLQFASRAVASGVHWGVLVLVFAAAGHWHWWRPLPWLLWAGLLGVVGLWLASPLLSVLGYITQLPGRLAYSFFFDRGDDAIWRWRNEHVYFRRGRGLVVSQYYVPMPVLNGTGDQRTVHLVPITPLWYWARPLPGGLAAADSLALVAQGWVPVNRDYAYFSFDPAEQARLGAKKDSLDAEDLRAHQQFEADPANRRIIEAVKHDAEMNRYLDSLDTAKKRSEE
ncbi:MAG: hypothetical protein ACRYFZ_01945 [Janthinobacterium lividum]